MVMDILDVAFHTTDWKNVETTRHEGETGYAIWKTIRCGNIRVRQVEYSSGYLANHWCRKGHILLCMEGAMTTELLDGRRFVLKEGSSEQVGDKM
jgi:hypothetical protein